MRARGCYLFPKRNSSSLLAVMTLLTKKSEYESDGASVAAKAVTNAVPETTSYLRTQQSHITPSPITLLVEAFFACTRRFSAPPANKRYSSTPTGLCGVRALA
ncbi:hypothetical protein KCP71_01950 [Salmonella enterica subsp. enterica]|nr:hypothetical protein KCP71_01950 [Salmonella enterica subsp. enterica]